MTKWLDKKIAERKNQQQQQQKERVDGRGRRGQITRKLASIPEKPNTELLNKLLDQWEEREYGRKR